MIGLQGAGDLVTGSCDSHAKYTPEALTVLVYMGRFAPIPPMVLACPTLPNLLQCVPR